MHRVIFMDWDNTIVSFGPFLVHILKEVAKEMDIEPISPITVPTKTKKDTLVSIFGHVWKDAESLFDEKFKQKPAKFDALLGAGEFLEKICLAGIPVAIISNKKKEDILLELQQQTIATWDERGKQINKEWNDFIKKLGNNFIIIGSTCVEKSKPDSESGFKALNHFQIPYESEPVEILHIGDGGLESDMGFAQNMTKGLQQFQPQSKCSSLLFNQYFDDYDPIEKEKFLRTTDELSAIPHDHVGNGYGGIGRIVRSFINPEMEKVMVELKRV